jgi:hypothetical protein
MKSLEPYQKKLGTDTWFYTKRCFLALFENMAKHLTILKDSFIAELIQFFTHCESKCCFCILYLKVDSIHLLLWLFWMKLLEFYTGLCKLNLKILGAKRRSYKLLWAHLNQRNLLPRHCTTVKKKRLMWIFIIGSYSLFHSLFLKAESSFTHFEGWMSFWNEDTSFKKYEYTSLCLCMRIRIMT